MQKNSMPISHPQYVRKLFNLLIAMLTPFGAACASAELPVQTRATWQPRCSDEVTVVGAPALALILAPKVIDAVVDHIADSVKAAAGSEAIQFKAGTEVLPFYDIMSSGEIRRANAFGCLIIIRGTFDGFTKEDIFAGLKDTHVRLEAKLQPIKGTKFFRLVPHYFIAKKLELGNIWSRTGDYSFAVNLKALGAEKPFGSASFTFSGVAEGAEFKTPSASLLAASSDPIAFPGDLADAVAARDRQAKKAAPVLAAMAVLESLKLANDPNQRKYPRPRELDAKSVEIPLNKYCSERLALNASLPEIHREYDVRCNKNLNKAIADLDDSLTKAFFSPEAVEWANQVLQKDNGRTKTGAESTIVESSGLIVSEVILTETRRANKFGLRLAGVLAASSDDIKKQLKEELPDVERKRQDLEAVTNRTNRQAILVSDLEVEKAEADLMAVSAGDASKVLAAQLELTKKRIANNEAYRKAGLAVRFPEYE